MADEARRDDLDPIAESSNVAEERGRLSPAMKVTLPDSFRREFAEVMGKVRSLVEDAESARADRAATGDLARVLELNAALLRSVFENQQRLLPSEERSQKVESLTLSTRALNDTFRSMSKSQDALAARLGAKEASRRGALVLAFSGVAAACVLAGLFVGILRERTRTDALRADVAALKQEIAQVDRDRLAELADHYEERTKSLEDDFLAGRSKLTDSQSRIDAAETRARELERERTSLKKEIEEVRNATVASEIFAKRESERADRLANELETTHRALDSVKDGQAAHPMAARSESARESTDHVETARAADSSTLASASPPAEVTEPKEVVSTDPELLERVRTDFNRLLGTSTTGPTYRLVAIEGVGPSFLQGVVVECGDGGRSSPKTVEAEELRVTGGEIGGIVELQFRNGHLLLQDRTYPFLNGRYGIPVLGAKPHDLANSAIPLYHATVPEKS
ncbi:MAG: hypothetical protein HYR85_00800 [Planctomycetes bacterium]|nr:hypothetical protein [Planctomycetota bacterium]MBI3847476.1 hypothetical protein [Planctomycetota bacterium]